MNTLNKLKIVVLATVLLTLNFSCKKNDTGGTATIHALIYHHDTPILGATTYVKFDSDKEPSDPINNYDLKIEGEEDENHVHIDGLRPGKYYVYASGYDSTAKKIVSGGSALKIKWSDRKKAMDLKINVGH